MSHRNDYGIPVLSDDDLESMDLYGVPVTDEQSFEADIENRLDAELHVAGELDDEDLMMYNYV